MNTHKHKSMEDFVVEGARLGPVVIVDLISSIQDARPGTTKQAVYVAIRKLKKDDVVVTYNKRVALNQAWVGRMYNFFSLAQKNYFDSLVFDDSFLNLSDGERVTYHFKSPLVTDQYWAHIFRLLTDLVPREVPVMLWGPHQWFMIARKESETQLFEVFAEQDKLVCVSAGGKTPMDVASRQYYDGEHAKYSSGIDMSLKSNQYINVFGDYIIDVRLDEKVSRAIDNFYIKNKEESPRSAAELKKIVKTAGKNKFTVMRNRKKAQKLRRQLAKNFFIPETYRSGL